jgi:hypothetical protein
VITDETLTMAAGADNSDAAIAQKFLTSPKQGGAPCGDAATGADPGPASGRDTADEDTSDDAATDDHAGSAAATDTAAHGADAPNRAPAESAAAGSPGQDETLTWYGDLA